MDLPSIDLETLEGEANDAERQRLREAARGFGAFLLTGHGVDEHAIEELLAESRRFFALPPPERAAIDMIHSPYFRGYSAAGSERTQGEPDLREQLDIGPEEEPVASAPGEPAYRRLHGPNLWPASQPTLRPTVLGWMRRMRDVSTRTMAALLDAVGSSRDLLDGFAGRPHERLKIIRYPPPAGGGHPGQGVGEHSDSGFLTLIVQDGTRGLQVHDGRAFVDAVAPRGALIAVAGRALHGATAGAVVAARHRVTSPPPGSERVSVAYFLNPRLDYADYGDEALAVVLRSHPATARRYFADLLRERSPVAATAPRDVPVGTQT